MIFTSLNYIAFILGVIAIYWLLPRRQQNLFLLVGSYIFYGYIHHWFCILLMVSTVTDYYCGLAIRREPDRKKRYVWISLIVNFGMLGVFKYYNFFTENVEALLQVVNLSPGLPVLKVVLPIGISFYTFQTLSYTIDIYRGRLEPRAHFLDFALFVSFFPQLVAGPIERARNLLPQIEQKRTIDFDRFESAICLIVWGYFKKLVVADNMAIYVNRIFATEEPTGLILFAGALAFTMQLYGDFSAYTDIARGSSRLLGFELMRNFKAPFLATSPADFWTRWHISLSTWIRDYVYLVLPGDRRNLWAGVRNQWITLILFGMWHGAGWSFFWWGVYCGAAVNLYVVVFRPFAKRLRKIVGQRCVETGGVILTFMATLGGMFIFRQQDPSILFGYFTYNPFVMTQDEWVVALGVLSFILFFCLPMLIQYACAPVLRRYRWLRVVGLWISIACIVFLGNEGEIDFIYFAF